MITSLGWLLRLLAIAAVCAGIGLLLTACSAGITPDNF